MNELKIFEHPRFGKIRTIVENGRTLFCGVDAANALGYKNQSDAISRHCRGVVKREVIDSLGRAQSTNFITEGDLCRLAAKSELPGADEFESWIFDEVIPAVLRNGGYIMGQQAMTPDELMAAALMVAQKTIENQKLRLSALTVQNQIMQPKADYFDDLVDRNLLTNFRDTAKQLHTKQNDFVSFLLRKKYVYRDQSGKLLPYQRHMDSGLFELKECVNGKSGWKGTQTLITPKGRETFRLLFAGAECGGGRAD